MRLINLTVSVPGTDTDKEAFVAQLYTCSLKTRKLHKQEKHCMDDVKKLYTSVKRQELCYVLEPYFNFIIA